MTKSEMDVGIPPMSVPGIVFIDFNFRGNPSGAVDDYPDSE
jgi:hypothetical protein